MVIRKRILTTSLPITLDLACEVLMQRETKNFAMLTVRELESLLKIDQKTIYRYVALGLIPYVRIQSNIRFVKEEIEGWVDAQSFKPRNGGNHGPY